MDIEHITRVIHDAEVARDRIEALISELEDLIEDHEHGDPDERQALQKWNEWATATK